MSFCVGFVSNETLDCTCRVMSLFMSPLDVATHCYFFGLIFLYTYKQIYSLFFFSSMFSMYDMIVRVYEYLYRLTDIGMKNISVSMFRLPIILAFEPVSPGPITMLMMVCVWCSLQQRRWLSNYYSILYPRLFSKRQQSVHSEFSIYILYIRLRYITPNPVSIWRTR